MSKHYEIYIHAAKFPHFYFLEYDVSAHPPLIGFFITIHSYSWFDAIGKLSVI